MSSTRSNLIADSLSYKNGVLNGGVVLFEEVKKDLVQDYLNKRNELNDQYQMFEKLEKNRQIDLAHRDAASLVIGDKKEFMDDVLNMHQTSAEYLRQKAIRLAAKANSKEVKVPDSTFNKLGELHQEINIQIDNSRTASSNVLDSYLSNFTDLTHFLNISDVYIKEEHHRLNDAFSSIISLLESIIDQLEELLDEEPDDEKPDEDGDGIPDDEEQDSDNDGIPDDIDPDQDGDNDPNNHDDDSGSTGGEGGTQGDAVHEGSNNSDRQRRIDPLVLDLDGDGLDFLSLDNSQAKFDLTGNGFATHTSWLSGDDGFLAIDKNNDGSINNIDELFGREDITGFEELELLDSNGDGKISIEDAAFEQLLIWQDKNGDGASTQEELKKLSDYDITEISLDRSASGAEKNDVLLEEVGHYVTVDANGNRQEDLLGDVLFSTRPTYSEFVGEVTLTDAAKAIANIQGYGMMPDLNAAMSLNKEFEAQILQFTRDLSSQTLTSGFDDILYSWAGSKGLTLTDIDSTPNLSADENGLVRFPNANVTLSIEQLGVLKAYTGINTLEVGDGIWNANGQTHTTGQLYLEAWNSIRANLVAKFAVSQGLLDHLIPSVTYDAASDTLQSTFDFKSRADAIFQKVASKLGNLKTANDAAELLLVLDVFEQFESGFSKTQKECVIDLIKSAEPAAYDWLANNIDLVKKIDNSILLGTNTQGGSAADFAIGSKGNDIINAGGGNDIVEGGLGDDTLHGQDGDDQLFGGVGNDTLTVNGSGSNTLEGGEGDDLLKVNRSVDVYYQRDHVRKAVNTFNGGQGNDRLEGSAGAETYVFNRGDGQDTINDYDHNSWSSVDGWNQVDRIVLGEGISRDELALRRDGNHMVLVIGGLDSGDSITIENAYTDKRYRIEQIELSDGTQLTPQSLPLLTTEGDDVVEGGGFDETVTLLGGNDTLNAGGGHDTVSGGSGNDTVHAGAGNDVVRGDEGDDTLHGQDGDDQLFGGVGNDTLTVNGSGSNTLEGGEGDDLLKVNRSVDVYYQRDHVRKAVNTFNGGQGNDRLEGSAGAETYVFNRGDGQDTINDYDHNSWSSVGTVGIKSTGLFWVKGSAEMN
ncbi:calcium-binding protein [Vibrio cholerae]|nr:calcium-binding protein [Vibrio cholerae]